MPKKGKGAPRRRARPGGGKEQRATTQAYAEAVQRAARPDPKPPRRERDPDRYYAITPNPGDRCPLCGRDLARYPSWSRHHVLPRSRGGGDYRANVVILCGDGTRGCHGKIEAYDWPTRVQLRQYLERHRPETIRYVVRTIATREHQPPTVGLAWLDRTYPPQLAA